MSEIIIGNKNRKIFKNLILNTFLDKDINTLEEFIDSMDDWTFAKFFNLLINKKFSIDKK